MNHKIELFNSQLSLEEILPDSIDFNHMNISNSPFSSKSETFQFFYKQIKLRNSVKKQLWNKTMLHSNNTHLIKVIDQIPNVVISSKVEQSIVNYLLNNPNSDFIGRIYQSTSNLFDKLEPSDHNNNLFLDPGTLEKDKADNNIHKLLTQAYMRISNDKMPIQILFKYKKKADRVIRKLWTVFPNVNFEFNQISNLPFSNTQLNKYLTSKTIKSNSNEIKKYKSGLLTLSNKNRLITLTDNHQIKNQVIIGLWLNFKEELPNNDQMDLNKLIVKYQSVIYQKCFEFVDKSSEIESVFSSNPDEEVFLLVIFYHGLQCQYEIKTKTCNFSNEKNIQINASSSNIDNKWLIAKANSTIDYRFSCNTHIFDFKSDHDFIKVLSVQDFIDRKFKINNQVSIVTKGQAIKDGYCINNNNNITLILPVKPQDNNNKERDKTDEQLQELLSNTYLDIDSFYDLYDYPLIMPQQFKHNVQLSSNNQEIVSKSNIAIKNNPNTEMPIQQNKKQNEDLYYSQASTNSHSNLLLSLKHSNNTPNNSINTLIQQSTQRMIEQENTLNQLNKQISQVEVKAHLLLNRILMSKKHTNDNQLQPTNTSIQVPHIRSINLTSLNDED